MKKVAIRKLVVGRETVKTLLTAVPGGRLRDVQGGGAAPAIGRYEPSKGACSDLCGSITKTPT